MVQNLSVQLRNDSGSTITMGTLSINAAASADIWDTVNFTTATINNLGQVMTAMPIFNENIGNSNLVMVVNAGDVTAQVAWDQFHDLRLAYEALLLTKNDFSVLRHNGEETAGLVIDHDNLSNLGNNDHPQYVTTDTFSGNASPDPAKWGSVLFHGSTEWDRLEAGPDGYVLASNGPLADLQWKDLDDLESPREHDAIVAADGSADYTSIVAAFNDGNKTVFVRSGSYFESANVVIPAKGALNGESGAIIIFSGAFGVTIDGNSGVTETTGTITVTNGSATFTGSGTTFTNLSSGDYIGIGGAFFQVSSITNDTSLEIVSVYNGTTSSGLPMFGQSMITDIDLTNITIVGSLGIGLFMRAVLGASIQGVILAGNDTNIRIDACGSVTLRAVNSVGSKNNGIDLLNSKSVAFIGSQVVNADLDGLYISNSDIVYFVSSKIEACGLDGVDVLGTCRDVTLTSSAIGRNSGKGVNIDTGAESVSMNGCLISANGGTGVDIDGSECVVDSCVIVNNLSYGIQSGVNALISDNHIEGNGNDGIALQSGDDNNVITSNHISNNTGDGIDLEEGDDCVISANRIQDNTGNGITIDAPTSGNKVTGNVVTGHTTDIANSSTSTIFGIEAAGNAAQGDVVYHNGTDWIRLGPGTSGQVLETQGAGSNPQWGNVDTLATTLNASNQDIDNAKTVTFNSVIAKGAMGATETITWNDGQKQSGTNSANCTITFANPDGPCNMMFVLTNGGAFTLTWPGTVQWAGGTEPTWTVAGVDVLSFFFDGTTYYGMAGMDFS